TNYSSGRLGWLEFYRNITQWRSHIVIEQLCNPVWDWFLQAASLTGKGKAQVQVMWTAPRRELIDPSKEVEAAIKQVRAGQISQSEAIRQLGYDPADTYTEIEKDNKTFDAKKLILDSDPRRVNRTGTFQGGQEVDPDVVEEITDEEDARYFKDDNGEFWRLEEGKLEKFSS
ncbi:MAG: hypothetical protein ACTSRU_18835, partial [Candidatus Hodarchaeales archaeon]